MEGAAFSVYWRSGDARRGLDDTVAAAGAPALALRHAAITGSLAIVIIIIAFAVRLIVAAS